MPGHHHFPSRVASVALAVLVALAASLAGSGCGNRVSEWALTALIETADSYVAPDSAPVVRFHITLSGTTATTADLTFEYSLDGGNAWTPMPVDDASDGTIIGNHVFDVASQFERHSIEWDTTGLAGVEAVDVVLRITLDDGSTEGDNGDGTAVVYSQYFSLDNRDVDEPDPVLDTPVVWAGSLAGGDGEFTLDVSAGDVLDILFGATDAGQTLTLTAEVTGGSLSAAAAGFSTSFPAQTVGVSPGALQLAGTASALVGNVELTVTVTDPSGGAASLRLLVIFSNDPPTIGTPVNAAGALSGADPEWVLTVATGDSLAINVPCTEPDSPPTSLTASVTGGNLTPAQAGFSTVFPKTVIGNTPVLQLVGTAPGVVGTLALTIVATDANGSQDTITLVVTINNSLPTFQPFPDVLIRQIGEGGFKVTGDDADSGDTLTISATAIGGTLTAAQAGYTLPVQANGPPQMFVSVSGTALQPGTLIMRFDLTDGHGYTVSMIRTLRINGKPVWGTPQGPTPVEGTAPNYTIYIATGEPLHWTIDATDPNDGDTLTVEVHEITGDADAAGFDPIVDVDGADGESAVTFQFSGQWATNATIVVQLYAYDDTGVFGWVKITFVLRKLPWISDPSIPGRTGTFPAWSSLRNTGDSLLFSIIASADGPHPLDTITFSVAVTDGSLTAEQAGFNSLPGPLNGRGTQQLNFTGTCAQPGWIELTFTADDTVRGHSEATLTIIINAPPLIATPTAPGEIGGSRPTFTATVGIGVSLDTTISASDPDGDDVTLSMTVTGGSLNVVDAGFTSAPTTAGPGPNPSLGYVGTALNAGTIEFTFLADDGNGRTSSYTLRIVIVTFRINSFTSSTGRPRYNEIVDLEWSIDGPTDTLRIDPPGYNVQGQSSRIATPFPSPLDAADPRTHYVLRATTPEYTTDTIAPESLRLMAKGPNGSNHVEVYDLARFQDGTIATVGHFENLATFFPGRADEVSVDAGRGGEGYLVIQNPDGTVRALRRMPGAKDHKLLHHVAFAPDGRLIVVGDYGSQLQLSAGEPDEIVLPVDGNLDTFIACYSPDGNLLWARRCSGTGQSVATGAAVLADGRMAIALAADSDMTLGSGQPGEIAVAGPTRGIAIFGADGLPQRFVRLFDDDDDPLYISARADGSIYIAARFRDGATIAPGQLGETVLTTAGTLGQFVARLDVYGQLQWVRTADAPLYATADAVVSLRDGGVAVAGHFGTSVTLGVGEANETTLTDTINDSFFVAAYNADGTLRWARSTDGATRTDATSIAEQPDGAIVVAGTLTGTTTFGSGDPGETAVTALAYEDVFGAVYAADGEFLRVETVGDPGNTSYPCVVETGQGGFMLAGNCATSVAVRAGQPDEIVVSGDTWLTWLASFEPVNFRILELRPGSVNRGHTIGGSNSDLARGIASSTDGSTYLAGRFEGYVRVDEAPLVNQVVGWDRDDVLLAKHAADGSFVWVAAAGGDYHDEALGVCVLASGDPVVVGYVRSTDAVFGDGEFKETHITNDAEGENAMFVARYDSISGDLVWVATTGGTAQTSARAVCTLADGRVVVGGYIFSGGSAIFGPGQPNETTINASSFTCLFIACYRPDGSLDWARGIHNVGSAGTLFRLAAGGGRVYALGRYNANAVFGPFEPGETPLQTNGKNQVYLASFSGDDGQLAWVRRMTSSANCEASGLDVASDGRVVCSGDADASVTLAAGHASQVAIDLTAPFEGWLAWFSSAGALDQVVKSPQSLRDLATLPDGTVACCGTLGSTPTVFGPGEPDETVLTGTSGQNDGWIAIWRANGTFAGASQIAGASTTTETAEVVDALPDGSIVVAGIGHSAALIGYDEPGEVSLTGLGGFDIFVARYHPFR